MINKAFKYLIVFYALSINGASAQELIQIADETITVNSMTSITGYTRNIVEVTLPENSNRYIYRLSVFSKGDAFVQNSLFNLLKGLLKSKISLAGSLTQFAIKNNDNNSVDAFIFTNKSDADNFYSKQDEYWTPCKKMLNRASCCFSTNECIGKTIFFGFRNNNISKGLDVKLEIVALIDATLRGN